jgi:hypothetical protein
MHAGVIPAGSQHHCLAVLDEAPVFDNNDAVSPAVGCDGGDAMTITTPLHRLYIDFIACSGFIIQRTGGLVEMSIRDYTQGTRNGDSLALAAGQVGTCSPTCVS